MDSKPPEFTSTPEFKAMVAKRLAQFGPGTPELNMFGLAEQFHAAGHRSLCGVREPGEPGVELHLAPGVVCYAFACELYLKALHQIALGRSPRGHKLNVLFGNLPVPSQQLVLRFYQGQNGADQKALASDLLNFSSAFEDWRYVYEKDGQELRLGRLIQLAIALYRSVRHQRPAWPMVERPPYVTIPTFMSGA